MRRFYPLLPISILILAFFFWSCEEENAGPPTSPTIPPYIESVTLPQIFALDSDYFHLFQVILGGDALVGTVSCELFDGGGNSLGVFTLRDDANAYDIMGEPDFASPTSGDVVAGDGIYTRRVNSMFADLEGEYEAVFRALANDSSLDTTIEKFFNVYENGPPVLSNLSPPLVALESGFEPFDLNLEVTDPQGRQDIEEVKFEIYIFGLPLGLEYQLGDPEMDSIFTFHFEPSFAAGMTTGDYTFRFSAMDSLGAQGFLPDIPVFIENEPPVLSEGLTDSGSVMTAPDPGDTSEVRVTVRVEDPQTLEDIASVYINYQRPDYLPPESIWTYGYPMADNGLPWDLELYQQGLLYLGDETAGDGIYTFTKMYTSTVDTGLHQFHIHCIDGAAQAADSLTVELRIQYGQ